MKRYLIEVFWSDEDQGYIAMVPDLPGCNAWGATPEESIREIQDAMDAWIDACQRAGDPIPTPTAKARHVA
jgi:antitoxin HicB